jgi:DNA-binding NtrC family response regulator
MRVLIVDDHEGVRRAVGRLLRCAGHQPCFAAGVREALAVLAGPDAPAVALVDLHLGDGPGTAVLRWIRERALGVRVAIFTASADGQAIVDASGERPDAFFAKPFDADEFLRWVGGDA